MSDVSSSSSSASRVLEIVRQLAQEIHPGHLFSVSLHASFERDLGLDSLARAELMLRIGKAFDLELQTEAVTQADTPRDVLRFLGRVSAEHESAATASLPGKQSQGVPEAAQTLLEVLEWHHEHQPDRTHILLREDSHGERPLSYRDLMEGAKTIAKGLIDRGLQARQTVVLMLPTSKDYLVSFFGVMMAGGIPVPIYPPARLAQIEDHLKRHSRLLANAEAAMMITVHEARRVAIMLQATVPSLAAIVTPADLQTGPQEPFPLFRPRADDIAFLQYTSGSTGDPKGVVLTHANLLANIRALGQASRVVPEDIFVSWLPLFHDMGLIGAWFGSLYHGIPLVLMSPLAFLAHPSLWLQTISRHRGTISGAPNFAYELCLRHVSDATLAELDLSSWRLAFNGAEPVSPATLEAFAKRFAPCRLRRQALTPVYGLAESSVGLAFPPLGRGPRIDVINKEAFAKEARAVPDTGQEKETLLIPSCGRALPGHAIRIVDEAEFELPERHIGLLEFRGPSATSHYFHNPQATARLFHDGWLDSGDYAYMAEGEVFITGREKDLIKRGGRNLYPYDLEEAAGKLPGIRKGCVAVFASTDSTSGKERLVIMAETRENDDGAQAMLRNALHQAALDIVGTPADEVVLVPPHTIPKTSSGKIRRIACRELYEHGQVAAHAFSPRRQAMQLAAAAGFAHARLMLRHFRRLVYGGYAWAIFAIFCLGAAVRSLFCSAPIWGASLPDLARAGCFD